MMEVNKYYRQIDYFLSTCLLVCLVSYVERRSVEHHMIMLVRRYYCQVGVV